MLAAFFCIQSANALATPDRAAQMKAAAAEEAQSAAASQPAAQAAEKSMPQGTGGMGGMPPGMGQGMGGMPPNMGSGMGGMMPPGMGSGMGGAPAMTPEELSARFKTIDKDNDGNMNWEEFAAAYPRMQRPAFDAMDTDKNGLVSKEEWLEFRTRHSKENAGMPRPEDSMTPPPGAMERAQSKPEGMSGMPMMVMPPNKDGGAAPAGMGGGMIMPPPGAKSSATPSSPAASTQDAVESTKK